MSFTLRLSLGALALGQGAQAAGKLLDLRLYVVALDRFRAFPPRLTPLVAGAWLGVELVALLGLGWAAATEGRPRGLWTLGAAAALVDALAYGALTIGTSVRGIEVLNCTCFGAFLPQRLSASVLAQDLVMAAWAIWTFVLAVRAK
ncbi:MAG: MauE/DoxX family redox-associated membrane protein [Polyangiaceae bacterium]